MIALYLVASVLLVFLVAYLMMISPRLPRRSMKAFLTHNTYFAHRGLHDESTPENSLPAFAAAVEHGFGIELDVQITGDGVPVVFHDDNMMRGCGVDRGIYGYTLEELRALPLFGREDLSIPTLADVLALVDGRQPIIVEIKASLPEWKETLAAAMKLLEDYSGPYCVESFNPLVLRELRKSYPAVLRGQLSEHYGVSFKAKGKKMPFVFWCCERFMSNAITKPDFVAYNCSHTSFFPFRLLTRMFPECTYVAWTCRRPEDEKTCPSYEAFIFEHYMPERKHQEDTDK